jgi:hypothetical protein
MSSKDTYLTSFGLCVVKRNVEESFNNFQAIFIEQMNFHFTRAMGIGTERFAPLML